MRRVPRFDAIVIVLVTAITVLTNLATPVVADVIVSAQAYATRIGARTLRTDEGAKIYQIQGLFSGSVDGFSDYVIADFKHSRVTDQSALAAIETMAGRYTAAGKRLVLRHLSPDYHALLRRAGQLVVGSDEDLDYGVAILCLALMVGLSISGVNQRKSVLDGPPFALTGPVTDPAGSG